MDETLLESAKRELEEETGITGVELEQLYTFGDPGRDPRARVITVTFHGMIEYERSEAKGGDDAADARWFSIKNLPELAFDHAEMMRMGVLKFKG